MTNVQWKMLAPYSALPVLLLAMVLVHWDRLSGTELLMRLVFTAFGYQAALGDLREKRVPNRLVAAMASAWVVIVVPQLFLHTEQTLYLVFSGVTGFLLAGVVFLAVYLISRCKADGRGWAVSGLRRRAARDALRVGALRPDRPGPHRTEKDQTQGFHSPGPVFVCRHDADHVYPIGGNPR